jgi:hypothetical protein
VAQKSALASTSTEAVIYDYNGKELLSAGFVSDISHIDSNADSLFVLSGNKVYAYNRYGNVFEKSDTAFTTVSEEGGFRRAFALEDKKHLLVTSEGAYIVSPEILADEETDDDKGDK